MNCKIVSDSSSNILNIADVPYATVPLKVITAEREYVDDAALDVAGMIADLRGVKGKTKTSCPNAFEWQEAFGDAAEVFAIAITSQLSGSFAAAQKAKEDALAADPTRQICVLDSLSTGPEMQLLIERMRADILSGAAFEEVEERVRGYAKHTHLLFSLKSMANLARNGRVNPVVAKVAGLLGIYVVGKASEQGTLEMLSKPRGQQKMIESVWAEMVRAGYVGGKVRVAHCFNPQAAELLVDHIRANYPNADIEILPTTALCSFYAEEGGLMIGFEDAGAQ